MNKIYIELILLICIFICSIWSIRSTRKIKTKKFGEGMFTDSYGGSDTL